MDGLASYSSTFASTFTVSREDAQLSLRSDLEAAEKDIGGALRLAAKHAGHSEAENDEHARLSERYEKQALDAERRVSRLRSELAELMAAAPLESAPWPDEFETDASMVVLVLRRLAECEFQLTPEECQDVHDVMQLESVEDVGDGMFQWTASLLLPYDGHVLRLGPVQGLVEATGRTEAPAVELGQRAVALARSADLRFRAEAAGVTRRAGRVLALAGQHLPKLPEVLLTHLDGGNVGTLGGVDSAWTNPTFLKRIKDVYTNPDFRWNNTAYLQVSRKRQAITDVVAAAGGRMTNEEFKAVMGIVGLQYRDLHSFTTPANRPRELPWPASVRREGSWERSTAASEAMLVSIDCGSCGAPATGVLYLPEVPGALLCRRCMGVPAAPDLRLPVDYAALLLPVTQGLVEVAERIAAARRAASAPATHVRPGLGHGRYTDAQLLGVLRDVQQQLPSHARTDELVCAALDALGYVRRGRAAYARLRTLAEGSLLSSVG